MLEEWIRNLSQEQLQAIIGDAKAQGSRIWQLAAVEMRNRQRALGMAA